LIEREPADAQARDALARVLVKTDRLAEARELWVTVPKLEPGNANNFLQGGLAAFMAGDLGNAERQLRTTIELDRTLTNAWTALGRVLSAAGRHAEAIELLDRAPEEAGRARILACRGDLQAAADNLSAATANYEAALALDPANTEALFHLATVLLPQGRVGDASDAATRAIQTQAVGEGLVDGLQLSLRALFSCCTRSQVATYLKPVLESLDHQGRLMAFEQALSLVVFALLKKQESVSEDRFVDTIWALENLVAGRVNVSIPVRFLNAGVDYFKREDRKALMKLSREERALFTKELGIETGA
jgi:tetratricopeptide (TPR) repeat protein